MKSLYFITWFHNWYAYREGCYLLGHAYSLPEVIPVPDHLFTAATPSRLLNSGKSQCDRNSLSVVYPIMKSVKTKLATVHPQ